MTRLKHEDLALSFDVGEKKLCLALMRADTEAEVIHLLMDAGYWDNDATWRCYGDIDKNYSEIGNQASRPEASLVEKLVNSVDARLMGECLARGIDPESTGAPQTMKEAVSVFFEDGVDPKSDRAGRIRDWMNAKRTEVAKGITLAATGATAQEGNPCFTIADCGEGQTPEKVPFTLLSLPAVTGSNKMRIPFVQGKFNMGGTGVLRFCGHHNLQLVLTRRNPAIIGRKLEHPSDDHWSFTVVRRESPRDGYRSSVYKYLAPADTDVSPGKGGILHFPAATMPIFPEGQDAYAREVGWGTLIKLYEYKATGCRTHMLRKDGLLGRLDILLPDIALPIRLYECRKYRGHQGSFETNLTGCGVRLDDDKAQNIEEGFPVSCPMSVAGEQMTAAIYVFKKGKADTYRKNEGIIFTVNGQTHGHLTCDFFRRYRVGLSYLSDSLFIILDCTKFSNRVREDLFMNSRDRLSGGDLRIAIEDELVDLLRNHKGLGELTARRRQEEIASKLDDNKPLENVLESLLKQSPILSQLFLQGKRISNPFKTKSVTETEKPFVGKRYPSYFKLRGKDYGVELQRDCHVNMRCRVAFETDAVNDYFSRDVEPGAFSLEMMNAETCIAVSSYTLNLQNGIASLSIQLPLDCHEGDELRFIARVTDPSQIDPFENSLLVNVKPAVSVTNGNGKRHKPPTQRDGKDREAPAGIALPNIQEVYEADWPNHGTSFDQYTALRIKNAPMLNNEKINDYPVYDFFVNMDNKYLKAELKPYSVDIDLTKARFKYGMVLLGLALLQRTLSIEKGTSANGRTEYDGGDKEQDVESMVEDFSKAVAPILVPMINTLGELTLDDVENPNSSGEPT